MLFLKCVIHVKSKLPRKMMITIIQKDPISNDQNTRETQTVIVMILMIMIMILMIMIIMTIVITIIRIIRIIKVTNNNIDDNIIIS